jgi:hypothetical protein
MAEIYEAKMPAGANFTVKHGRDFTRIVILTPTQSVPCSDGLRQPEIDVLEETWGCFSVPIEFGKHECMKRIVYRRSDFGRDNPVPLGIDQQHSRGSVEFRQNLRDSHLL